MAANASRTVRSESRWRNWLTGILLAGAILARPGLAASIPEQAEDLATRYATSAARPPAEVRGPLMRMMEPLMVQQARALVSQLLPWGNDPRCALLPLTSKTPSSESGIRPNAHTAKGLAIMVRLMPDEAFSSDFTREQARGAALSILRYLVRTHGAGPERCADNKTWGGQWQSAYWAAMAGEAAWLLWDDLSPSERWLAARMITTEADRFVALPPPSNLKADSKAEENAWNSQVVSLAFNQFPHHERHAIWRETAIRWIASSFPTSRDMSRTDLVDGRPLKTWLSGANLLDDFTLENHHRVHPDYMACTYLLTSQVPMYVWGGNPPPQAIDLNVREINRALQILATPEGSVIYPNGQDWGLHRNVDWFEFHAAMAVLYHDVRSAALARHALATVRDMAARTPRGTVYLPSETKLASDQHMVLEYLAHTYALMADRGEGPEPVADAALWAALAGTRVFPEGQFAVARTPRSIATFSWGAQVMGQVVPLRGDLLLTPEPRGLVGYVVPADGERETPAVRQFTIAPLREGFGLVGILARANGKLEQRFGFLALPDGRVVYVDRIESLEATSLAALDLGTLGVLNDLRWPRHDGSRTFQYEGGRRVFVAANASTDSALEASSPWYNLDDALGVACLGVTGRALYTPAPTGAAGRLEQRLHLNALPKESLSQVRAGQEIARGVFVFYPNRSAEETKRVTAACALLPTDDPLRMKLRLDDGVEVAVDLNALRLTVTPPASP